ncbi:MAG: hypothetical protein ACKPKO_56320, partial [Candidatus Fonsibacter sp.]
LVGEVLGFDDVADLALLLRLIPLRRRLILLRRQLLDGEGHALCGRQNSQIVDEDARALDQLLDRVASFSAMRILPSSIKDTGRVFATVCLFNSKATTSVEQL